MMRNRSAINVPGVNRLREPLLTSEGGGVSNLTAVASCGPEESGWVIRFLVGTSR
jgi:hypothetical protein